MLNLCDGEISLEILIKFSDGHIFHLTKWRKAAERCRKHESRSWHKIAMLKWVEEREKNAISDVLDDRLDKEAIRRRVKEHLDAAEARAQAQKLSQKLSRCRQCNLTFAAKEEWRKHRIEGWFSFWGGV